MFSPLNNIINHFLQDINKTMTGCEKQIQITNKNIQEIEYLIQNKNTNEHLRTLIQKNNQLLLDNFCLISEQTKLVEYYQKLVIIMGRNQRKSMNVKKDDVLYELLEYYKQHNNNKNVEILNDYLKRVA